MERHRKWKMAFDGWVVLAWAEHGVGADCFGQVHKCSTLPLSVTYSKERRVRVIKQKQKKKRCQFACRLSLAAVCGSGPSPNRIYLYIVVHPLLLDPNSFNNFIGPFIVQFFFFFALLQSF